jgi:two-component sensor histidine kinase
VVELSYTVAQRDALLEAQSLLTREVDHRIKNSLQMVTSVLAMQAAAAESESEQRALQQACSRVQAVAHAHGLLYRSGGSDSVPFREYLTALCKDLHSTLAPEATGRSLDCSSDAGDIPVDYALPLALVVNELVTNAFKHAFPDGRTGRIEVSFRRRKPGSWRLTVADDGIGLPSWPPPLAPHSLGTRIVGALVERLHGRLEVATDRGTCFTLDIEPS